ncbi:unnamed protein product [Pleuronectes platessa]|uniref:Uncharacterized protein n=1 Tax=Pleuronectes platessa TaxID=8262 RepID=A0A9N7YZD5_PLEPL|nr:unnamed protein product [Pleuronectes platessa]
MSDFLLLQQDPAVQAQEVQLLPPPPFVPPPGLCEEPQCQGSEFKGSLTPRGSFETPPLISALEQSEEDLFCGADRLSAKTLATICIPLEPREGRGAERMKKSSKKIKSTVLKVILHYLITEHTP